MKALMIYPKYPDTFWGFKYALKFISKKALHPPLGLITVAAMLPEQWEKRLIDMNVSRLKEKDLEWADYVFISAMAVQKPSVMELIGLCREKGVKVVAGGPLFTADPGKFAHVDHLVLNEAEITLPRFLEDLEKGRARRVYSSGEFVSLRDTPVPLWELLDMGKYVSMSLQYSRGCPFNCEFCDITVLYGRRARTKDKGQILDELKRLHRLGWRGGVFFVDDNFIGNSGKLKEHILPDIIAWMKEKRYPFDFSTEASINIADDEDLMQLMISAGFEGIFVGIETPDDASLAECNKMQNKGRDLAASVRKVQKFGLRVRGGFIVGFDNDSSSTFERQISFIQNTRIVTAMVGLLNAPRGTKLYERVEREGRLVKDISGDNTDFSTNISPSMGYEKLIKGYRKIIEGIYSPGAYHDRVKNFIREYKPLIKRRRHFHMGLIRYHSGYPGAFFKSIFLLGLKDRDRLYYWRLFLWAIFNRPRLFPMAIAYSIYGYHFKKIFQNYM